MEKESESKSGKGTVRYKQDGKDYSLEVELVNGLKEGKGVMMDPHHIVITNLTFSNDELNGECVIRNESMWWCFEE